MITCRFLQLHSVNLDSTNVLEVDHTTIDSISHSECVSLPTQLPEKDDLTHIGPTPVQNFHSSTVEISSL